VHQPRGPGEEADARARHPEAVRDRERGHGVVGELERGQRAERHVGIDDQRRVRDVMDEQQVMLVGEPRQGGQLTAALQRP